MASQPEFSLLKQAVSHMYQADSVVALEALRADAMRQVNAVFNLNIKRILPKENHHES